MPCEPCLLLDIEKRELAIEDFLDQISACDDCPEAAANPSQRISYQRLRQSARFLRKTQSKLRQRENDLADATNAVSQFEARIENMERLYKQSSRELEPQLAVVERQAETIRALSTPVLDVLDGALAMPIIGSLDEQRSADLTSKLLNSIVERRARFVILDLTGLEEVGTQTAVQLLKVCAAVQLLGAKILLCGIRQQVAKEFVATSADLQAIRSVSTLRAALQVCRAETEPGLGLGHFAGLSRKKRLR